MAQAQEIIELNADEPSAISMSAKSAETSLVSMLERIVFDPNIPIDRMHDVFDFYKRVKLDGAKAAYTAALSAMQPNLPAIDAKGKIVHNNKVISQYAKWEDVNDAIKPVLAQHGFALDFTVTQDEKSLTTTAMLEHSGGFAKQATLRLPIDTSGAKNAVQAIGSTVAYGKRYTAGLVLNLTSRAPADADDDGRAAGGDAGSISEEQVKVLQAAIVEVDADVARFLKYLNVEKIEDIPAKDFARAMAALGAKKKAAAK